MNESYCMCFVESFHEKSLSILEPILTFVFSLIISICGVFLNYKFHKKLKIERRNKPLGRKGNVIEPIMRWFLVIQIIYWPYQFLMFHRFMYYNIISMIPPFCPFYIWSIILGRTTVAYNSMFVVLIRYVYIVHERKANQWDFEKVGRRFQIASISTPLIQVIVLGFSISPKGLFPHANHCPHETSILLSITREPALEPLADAVTIMCAITMGVVYLNLMEGYLYIRIFQRIYRYVDHFCFIYII